MANRILGGIFILLALIMLTVIFGLEFIAVWLIFSVIAGCIIVLLVVGFRLLLVGGD